MIRSSNHLPVNGKGKTAALEHPAAELFETNGQLMDVRGVAAYLKLDRQTIYNWLHQQKISAMKVGGVWRFDRRVIDEWLQARTVPPKE